MAERPILFSAPMVRAILEGRKTQTRRVFSERMRKKLFTVDYETASRQDPAAVNHLCPYGQPGDTLWVREAWRVAECYDDKSGADLAGILSTRNVQYTAQADQFLGKVQGRYRHARFMPRWASRITLRITGVRVERVHDINARDCWAEGIPSSPDVDPIHEYRDLWESINGAGSWDANPWVWVVEFDRVTGGGDG